MAVQASGREEQVKDDPVSSNCLLFINLCKTFVNRREIDINLRRFLTIFYDEDEDDDDDNMTMMMTT